MKKITSILLATTLLFGAVPSAFAAKPLDGNITVTVKPLVILMDFPDYKHNDFKIKEKDYRPFFIRDTYEKDWYQQLFFGDTYTLYDEQFDSMKTYFKEQSRGRYIVDGGIAGWYTAKNGILDYGKETQDNAAELVREAIAAVANDPNFDLSEYDMEDKYDYNQDGNYFEPDGIIDTIIMVHAGRGDEWGSGSLGSGRGIWPFRGKLSWYDSFSDDNNSYKQYEVTDTSGKKYKAEDFVTVAQDSLPMLINHEFGHTLGLPDIYGSGNEPARNWSIMSSNYLGSVYATMSPQFGALGRETLQEKLGGDWARMHTIDFDNIDQGGTDVTIGTLTSGEPIDMVRVDLPPKLEFVKPYGGTHMYYSQKADEARNSMSTNINLTEATGQINLEFKTMYDIEKDWDYASVQVKEVGSNSWTAIKGNITTDKNPNGNIDNPDGTGRNPGHGITGDTKNKQGISEWHDAIFDLTAYAGKNIDLRFYFWSDANTPKEGIYIDDIKIITGGSLNRAGLESLPSVDSTVNGNTELVEGPKGKMADDQPPSTITDTGKTDTTVTSNLTPPVGTDLNPIVGDEDATPPIVVSSSPNSGDLDVAIDKEITITFSENIVASDAFQTITLTKEDGTIVEAATSIVDNLLSLTPVEPLGNSAVYRVNTPANSIKDAANHNLENDYSMEFTTVAQITPPALVTGETVIFSDDAEGESLFTFDGFKQDDGTKINKHYYLLEWRNHEGTDRSLKSYNLGNWVEKGAYDPGLVIWYINESLGTKDRLDQDVSDHPGKLSVGVVDADQSAQLKRTVQKDTPSSDWGSLMRDSAFSLRKGSEMVIELNEGIIIDPELAPHPVFNDNWDYTNKTEPQTGLILDNEGLQVYITEESASRRSAKVHIANANNPLTYMQGSVPNIYFDDNTNEVVVEAQGNAGYNAHVGYKNGDRTYFQALNNIDGKFIGKIDTSAINPKENWQVDYILIDGAELNAPVIGKKVYYSGADNEQRNSMITSLDLSATTHPRLEFKTWYDIEKNWDYSSVQVKEQGTKDWIALQGNITTTDNPNYDPKDEEHPVRNPGHGITGSSPDQWTDAIFDLSVYAGKKIDIKIESWTDANTPKKGIYVGDIRVLSGSTVIFAEDIKDKSKFELAGFKEETELPLQDSVKAFYNSQLNPLIGSDFSSGTIHKEGMNISFKDTPSSFKLDSDAKVTIEVTNNNRSVADATLIVALYNLNGTRMYTYASASKGIQPKGVEQLTTSFSIPQTGTYKVKAFVVNNWDDMQSLVNPLEIQVKP